MLSRLRDVFASLNSHRVKYIVIGGTAAVLHGVPRATFDLDALIEATPENASNLLAALRDAGFGTAAMIEADELLRHEITVFRDRYRVDIQTSTPGLQFEDAWPRRIEMTFDGVPFYVAHKDDLIASKRAANPCPDPL
jgi:tRNA nucleotidyltransferase/poly(A) polymerase